MSDHDNSKPPRRRRSRSRSGSNFEAANSHRKYPFYGSPNATRKSRAGSVSSVCSDALSEGGKCSLLEKTAGFGPARMEKMLTSHLGSYMLLKTEDGIMRLVNLFTGIFPTVHRHGSNRTLAVYGQDRFRNGTE
ncbi:hypothetical protein RvY_16553-1 [Ramazzottius varieornatus]|uniref:Uncharacterized protein n=1 Tax=Ramazzottius varieornatus TaxID=947166 RepID=A0A1D1W6D4_RAMVA|nr:hypothetical protein RvY_16553-1 [Ramazzottius varieornatus]